MGKSHKTVMKKEDRPENNLYHTPFSLTWLLAENINIGKAYDPACGSLAIVKALNKYHISSYYDDIDSEYVGSQKDFLDSEKISHKFDSFVMNPPFDLWNSFIIKAKEYNVERICSIGQMDYWSTFDRYDTNLFRGLKYVLVFNRKVDYRTTYREDGLFCVGAMASAWFVWERSHFGPPQIIHMNVQPWAKLGPYKAEKDQLKFEDKTKDVSEYSDDLKTFVKETEKFLKG